MSLSPISVDVVVLVNKQDLKVWEKLTLIQILDICTVCENTLSAVLNIFHEDNSHRRHASGVLRPSDSDR